MIEPLKNRVYPDGMIIAPSWAEVIAKINELVDHANGLTRPINLAEPTEKMYSLDEVAEMLYRYDENYGSCGIWDMPKHTAGFCKQNSCGGQCKDPIECWKHAIQSGWLKGE